MSKGIVFLPSFYEAIVDLPDDQRLQMYDAIVKYGLYGEITDLPAVTKALFTLIKPVIDSSQNRYRAAKENGSKPPKDGANPRGRPQKNQTENQRKNQTENQDKDIDSDIESEKDKENGADKPPRSPVKKKYGEYGHVELTDEQHSKLLQDLGQTELERCIQYIDESAQINGNKNRWKDWNLVLRRCSREGWGKAQAESDWKRERVVGWKQND